MIKKFVKFPKKLSQKQIEQFFIDQNLKSLIYLSKGKSYTVNEMIVNQPHKPELVDLYRLYNFVILNMRTTVLEFGSGFSSIMFSLTLQENKRRYYNKIKMMVKAKTKTNFVKPGES